MTVRTMRPSYRGFAVEVVGAADLSQTFRRITFTGPDLHEFGDALLDQRIKLILATPAQAKRWPLHDSYGHWRGLPDAERPAMRTYTVAGLDQSRQLLTVDIACRPAHGPASEFALKARPGDPLVILGPDALSEDAREDGVAWWPGEATEVVIVGDETALPAIRNIVRTLPPSVRGHVVLELPTVGDAVDLPIPHNVDLRIVMRSGAPGAAAHELVRSWSEGLATGKADVEADAQAGEDLIWDEVQAPKAQRYGWLAGEAGGVVSMRRALLAAGALQKSAASFMGYWKLGRSESA